MIKKLIGLLFTAATLVVIVCAVLGRDRYRSLWIHEGVAAPRLSAPRPEPEPAAPVGTPAAAASEYSSPDEYFEDDDELPSDLFQDDVTL